MGVRGKRRRKTNMYEDRMEEENGWIHSSEFVFCFSLCR